MLTRLCVLMFVLTQFAGAARARADIVGGEPVAEPDPIRASTVGLYTPSPDGRGGALCTASIIGKDMAVTAAHCISPGGPKPVVLFGSDLHSPQTVARPVVAAKVNPLWGRKKGRGMDQGDIALVKFKDGLPPGYHKIGMASSEAALKPGADAVLAGYGISNARTHAGSGILRKTQVKLVDSRKGKPEMIFDQTHRHGACHGDSGGPALVQYRGKQILAGVTNRSYPDSAPDDCAHQVVYTKVSAYKKWISQEEKALRSKRDGLSSRRRAAGQVEEVRESRLTKGRMRSTRRARVARSAVTRSAVTRHRTARRSRHSN